MTDVRLNINKPVVPAFLLHIIGYVIIYSVLEIVAGFGDPLNPVFALIIALSVVATSAVVEVGLLKSRMSEVFSILGFGIPSGSSVIFAVIIALLLFLCFPLITSVTGYEFMLPANWVRLALGVFVLHGIAEEVLYRGYLFNHLRQGRSFAKAVWLSVLFFTLAHIPIMITQGIFVGGTAVLLAAVSSFPLSRLYERGNNTIWAPAIVHFAIDMVTPIVAAGEMTESAQKAVMIWMGACMVIPYIAFLIPRSKAQRSIR